MDIGRDCLSNAGKQIFIDILFEFEGAIAFDNSEMGLLTPEIEPPVVIHMVPHTPWQQQNIPLPKAIQEVAREQVKAKLTNGMLECSHGPYTGLFSINKKNPSEFRFVNVVQLSNGIMIRNSPMLPTVDEFSEDFAGFPLTSSADYYSGFNQIRLDVLSM